MAKTEVDLAALAAAISQTILGFASDVKEEIVEKPVKTTRVPREKVKRSKVQKKVEGGLIGSAEVNVTSTSTKDYNPEPSRNPFEIQNRKHTTRQSLRQWEQPDENEPDVQSSMPEDSGKNFGRRVQFEKKVRPNTFKDNLTLATADLYTAKGKKKRVNKLYPQPVDRRPPEIERTYKCDYCNKKFKAFSSYIPHSADGDSHPMVRCQRCSCK